MSGCRTDNVGRLTKHGLAQHHAVADVVVIILSPEAYSHTHVRIHHPFAEAGTMPLYVEPLGLAAIELCVSSPAPHKLHASASGWQVGWASRHHQAHGQFTVLTPGSGCL